MNSSSRRGPVTVLAELSLDALEEVSGGGANWGTCFTNSMSWGLPAAAGGAIAGGGVPGAAGGFLAGAGGNFLTDPNCYNGTDSYSSAAGRGIDNYFSGSSGGSADAGGGGDYSGGGGGDNGGGDYGY